MDRYQPWTVRNVIVALEYILQIHHYVLETIFLNVSLSERLCYFTFELHDYIFETGS